MVVDAVQQVVGQPLAAVSAPLPPEELLGQRALIQAVRALNATELFGQNSELTFVLDRETRRPLVRLIDRKTNEVIRQIPPEYVLRMARDLKGLEEKG
jgi:uncharacterized FlaG/YvyC family protein